MITLFAWIGLISLGSAKDLASDAFDDYEWVCSDTYYELVTDEDSSSSEISDEPEIIPVQAVAPQLSINSRRRPVSGRGAARSAVGASALAGVASVPYMIGGTGAGTCLGFQGLLQAQLAHPTLACARLNIAEANSPLPTNRFYYSYRHFHNASDISAYQFGESVDLDRHLLAWEHLFWDDMASLEFRLPIEMRMRSDIFSLVTPNFGVVDPLVGPNGGRRTEFGNIATILKLLLIERSWFAMSGGLGLTLPTAQDVNYNLAASGEMAFANSPGLTAEINYAFQGNFENQSVYIEPFLAWIAKAESSPWFHQGFLQFEVAANPSDATFFGLGATDFYQNGVFVGFYDFYTADPASGSPNAVPVQVELFSQTLMRLNMGTGYMFIDRPQERGLRQMAGLFEMHYTTTLADSNLSNVPLTEDFAGGTVPVQTITVGNGKNRVDILNAATGVSMNYAGWIVTNGVIVPLRDETNRGFDFEYNVQLQKPF